jgi:deoxyribodipyrimidine photo-lyase
MRAGGMASRQSPFVPADRAHLRAMDDRDSLTRAAGLARMQAYAPHMGRTYETTRNTDRGPDDPTTSRLSPYLRRRLLMEPELIAVALRTHGAQAADKFVQEVFWRGYFKGHLETRPFLWDDASQLAAAARARMAHEPAFGRAVEDACAGRTGIACFDDWAAALVRTNWLHNHTRMWFASIWIFTLGLPWALGADFFMRHLIDGDPASNTLSWRWVAGLHTRGKPYAARAENIHRYTDGRYNPTGLNEAPAALLEPAMPPSRKLPEAAKLPRGDVALLLHLDDLHSESLDLGGARVVRVGGFLAHADGAAEAVRAADRAALDDALSRAASHFECPVHEVAEGWEDGLPVVAPMAPCGPSASAMPACVQIRRPWDSLIWPHATKGFFQVKAAIPAILDTQLLEAITL